MKSNKFIFIITLLISCLAVNSVVLANDLPFENYKQGIIALENGDWTEAKHYFDEVILQDLSYSDYLAKSIYFKTILLAAEIDRDLELQNLFSIGKEEIPFKDKENREKFDNLANNYKLAAKRKVDTLIGLANYLVAHTPPVQIEVESLYAKSEYDSNLLDKIKAGTMIPEAELKSLQAGFLNERINKYLGLTLGIKSINNVFVIRAEQGDNLYDLSYKYEVPLQLLIEANSHIKDPNKIYPDGKVYIPKVNNSHVNYPAYFYYISDLAYQANQNRREDITRLVLKAYQLTNKNDSQDIATNAKQLINQAEVNQYQNKVKVQSEQIKLQNQKIKRIKRKYNQLIKELQELKGELKGVRGEQEQKKTNKGNYDPSQDPLNY